MKKTFAIIAALMAVLTIVGCAGAPIGQMAPIGQPQETKAYPPKIIEHKGTAFGRDMPKWMDAALDGHKAVEKLPEYAGKYVVVVSADGKDLTGAQLVAGRMDAQTSIAQMISTQVQDSFNAAQVGDKDKIESYMERTVKSLSSATFSGFAEEADWWVKLQTYTADGKASDQIYRVIQIWDIDKDRLMKQIDKILDDNMKNEPEITEGKQRAMDLVKQSVDSGF